ncbi:MAG: MFS transporter [Acidimicrobiales bacterium]
MSGSGGGEQATVPSPPRVVSGRSLGIWGAAALAYFVSAFQRATLGVSSITVSRRFGLQHSALAALLVVQLIVYATMQAPVGAVLGRLGSRRLLITGALFMAASQLTFALTDKALLAVLARLLLGAGDAMTFVSVLRVSRLWLPDRLNPLFVQLTGLMGLLGGLVAALPLLLALRTVGWTITFLTASGLSLIAGGAVYLALPKTAPQMAHVSMRKLGRWVRRDLVAAWRSVGTRLGLWTTFTAAFPSIAFSLLWGFPFMVEGEHLSAGVAAALLSLLNVAAMALGPLFGYLGAARPWLRPWLVFGTVFASALTWAGLLAWPGPAPLLLVVALMITMGANSPAALIGFDYARTLNPTRLRSSASGLVNVGGFISGIGVTLAVGFVLGVAHGAAHLAPTLGAFKLAFAVQFVFWALGIVGVLHEGHRLSTRMGATPPFARE